MIFNRYLLYHKDHPKNTDAYVEFWEEKESGTWVCNCCYSCFFFEIWTFASRRCFQALRTPEVCLTSTSCPTSKIAPGRISRVSEIWRKQLAEALSEQQFWYTSMLIAPTHSCYSGLISHFLDPGPSLCPVLGLHFRLTTWTWFHFLLSDFGIWYHSVHMSCSPIPFLWTESPFPPFVGSSLSNRPLAVSRAFSPSKRKNWKLSFNQVPVEAVSANVADDRAFCFTDTFLPPFTP